MKPIKYLLVFLLISFISISFLHGFVRPQHTRVMLIDWYDFAKDGQLYYRSDVAIVKIDSLKTIITMAENRVGEFWGTYTASPKVIYCDNDADYRKFGNPALTPAVAFMNLEASVVIHPSGLNLDVIAHEFSHTELFSRIGYLNREKKIPTWFDEGLAMQVDWRPSYSTDSLRSWTDGFIDLPRVRSMVSYRQFGSGDVRLNYSTAKYEVGKWHTPEKLETFIATINVGGSFDNALGDF